MSGDNKLSLAKKRLLDHLGPEYKVKKIDSENCIYLDMGKCDIEISRGRTIKSKVDVYVWQNKDKLHIIERYLDIEQDLEGVKELLNNIRARYFEEK